MPGAVTTGFGGPISVLGRVDKALFFAGSYVEVPPHGELDFGIGGFSLDAWVRVVRCGPGLLAAVVDKWDPATNTGFAFYVEQSPAGTAFLRLRVNASTFSSTGTFLANANPLQDVGPWVHVAVTVDRAAGVGTFFINGSPAGTFVPPAGTVTNALSMLIGRVRVPGGICELAIDELQLFNRPLTAKEVQEIYQAGAAGKCLQGQICVVKFADYNGDGTQDPGEPGLHGWAFQVQKVNTIVGTITTDQQGQGCLTVEPGSYTVIELGKVGWAPTVPVEKTVDISPGKTITVRFGNVHCFALLPWLCPPPCLWLCPPPCPTPCQELFLCAGDWDDFAAVGPAATDQGQFDQTAIDTHFEHRFTFSVPSGMCVLSATLTVRLRPLGHPLSDNDQIHLTSGGTTWSGAIGPGPYGGTPPPPTLPILLPAGSAVWRQANYPQGYVFTLNLANLPGGVNLLPDLTQHQSLTFYLQDDTAVDWICLRLVLCPCPGEATICITKFNDLNGNGKRDPGEPALPGWTFTVTDQNGNVVGTVTTVPQFPPDAPPDCWNSLVVSAPGTYTITESPKPGWVPTTPSSATVTVLPGQTVPVLFGNKEAPPPACDLKIEKKVSPNPVVVGPAAVQVHVVLTVTNVGTGACPGPTTVTETIPAGLTFVSGTGAGWSCLAFGGNVVCTYPGTIPVGGSTSITLVFTVTAKPGTEIRNCAKVSNANDTNPANNEDCKTIVVTGEVGRCDLAIRKDVRPNPVASGGQVTVVLTITNVGTAACPGPTTVTETIPAGLSFVSASGIGWSCLSFLGNVVCTYPGTIPVGGSTSITLVFTVTARPGTRIENCATVSNPNDANPANNRACVTIAVVEKVR
jgi:uncharacterized repeat protein (TIGR01451 family)